MVTSSPVLTFVYFQTVTYRFLQNAIDNSVNQHCKIGFCWRISCIVIDLLKTFPIARFCRINPYGL